MQVVHMIILVLLAIDGRLGGGALSVQLLWPTGSLVYWQNSTRVHATFQGP
jgi:hypothetical protein